jgi:hypothetical protein
LLHAFLFHLSFQSPRQQIDDIESTAYSAVNHLIDW